MDVILLNTVPSLGERGETVKVKPGYARNFLFPRKLALPARDSNRRVFKEEEKVLAKRDELEKNNAQHAATKLTDVGCNLPGPRLVAPEEGHRRGVDAGVVGLVRARGAEAE